jgi:hypothetical protein
MHDAVHAGLGAHASGVDESGGDASDGGALSTH